MEGRKERGKKEGGNKRRERWKENGKKEGKKEGGKGTKLYECDQDAASSAWHKPFSSVTETNTMCKLPYRPAWRAKRYQEDKGEWTKGWKIVSGLGISDGAFPR